MKIKKSSGVTKFKVRCSRYLYTLSVTDSDKAEKLKQSLPPGAPGGRREGEKGWKGAQPRKPSSAAGVQELRLQDGGDHAHAGSGQRRPPVDGAAWTTCSNPTHGTRRRPCSRACAGLQVENI